MVDVTHRVGLSNSRSSRTIQHFDFGLYCFRKMEFDHRYVSTIPGKVDSLCSEVVDDKYSELTTLKDYLDFLCLEERSSEYFECNVFDGDTLIL